MSVLAGIIILGILAQWVAWRIKVPAILPLILIGLAVGPLAPFWTPEGQSIIVPIYDHESQSGIFPGEYLFYFVSLAIGIILFEGGLTLKRSEVKVVGPYVLKLITLGSLVTFVCAGLAAHWLMDLSWSISFLFSALIIVTGPTVIGPILQNLPLNRNVSAVLKWESILIDPLGALASVLVFEFIRSAHGGVEFTSHAFTSFFQILLNGLALGTIGALGMEQLFKRDWVPAYLLNVFSLAYVLLVYVFSDYLAHESGLLTVVVMGMVLGNRDVPKIQEILHFKESLSILLISMLFILLAANITLDQLILIVYDWRSYTLFGIVVLLVRPLGVFLSTRGSELRFHEKVFISWVGPRGIVAAGIASLFGITLSRDGVPGAEYITPLVFMIVLGTVMLNATTAGPIAKMLKVLLEKSEGVLFIGANAAARIIAKYLQQNGRHVVLIDNNTTSVQKATLMGLEAYTSNLYTDKLDDNLELLDMGYMVAMTSSAEVNQYAVKKYQAIFGENGTFRLLSSEELKREKSELPDQGIFSYTDDFLNFNEIARDFPDIHEIPVTSFDQLQEFLSSESFKEHSIALFLKDNKGQFHPIPAILHESECSPDDILIYMGKKFEME